MNKKFYSFKRLTGFSFLFILFLLGTNSTLYAQEKGNFFGGDRATRFGFKGGANVSQLYIDQVDGNSERSKWGWHAGIFVKAPVSDYFAFQPELLYSNAGTKVSYQGSNLLGVRAGEVRYNLNYVQVPLLAAITLGPVSLQFGPYGSYLIDANIRNLQIDDPLEPTGGIGLDESDFERFDYGLVGGVAMDIKGFQLGVRYNYGLREISDKGLAGRLVNNSKNSVAQIYLGIAF
jgi:hypothetical protein